MSEKIHGELPRFQFTSQQKFSHISTLDISCELLHRLQTENQQDLNSYELISLLPNLQKELDRKLEVFENRFSLKWLEGLFYGSYRYWEKHNIPIANATYVDIGCGAINPFGFMFLYLMLGAKKCFCLEPDSLQNPDLILENLAQTVGKIIINPQKVVADYPITREEIIKNIASFKLESLAQGEWKGLDQNRLIYLQESVTNNTIPDNEADVMVTNSVLEHLPDLDAAFKEFNRITKKGGYGIHNIDGIDHWSYSNPQFHPLEFLKVDTLDAIVHLSNRIRPLSFVEIFERHGFEVLEIKPYRNITVEQSLRDSFVEPFRSMNQECLEVAQAYFLVRKL
jgi:SAM-dependent methyltransferase